MRTALITGISGQDGYYLAKLLLEKGYSVHGLTRKLTRNPAPGGTNVHAVDLRDLRAVREVVKLTKPDEIYHLSAPSHVGASFDAPEVYLEHIGTTTLNLLEVLRRDWSGAKLFNASSSEVFAGNQSQTVSETSALIPESPYGCSKAYALMTARVYREAHNLFVSSGLLFNHESERRPATFVTQKIALAAKQISRGKLKEIELGNLEAKRDWGWAPEFMEGIWRSLQLDEATDFVYASGRLTTVREFVTAAFSACGLEIRFEGAGQSEQGYNVATGEVIVTVNPEFFRPTDSNQAVADPSKARSLLGWQAATSGVRVAERLVRGHQPEKIDGSS